VDALYLMTRNICRRGPKLVAKAAMSRRVYVGTQHAAHGHLVRVPRSLLSQVGAGRPPGSWSVRGTGDPHPCSILPLPHESA